MLLISSTNPLILDKYNVSSILFHSSFDINTAFLPFLFTIVMGLNPILTSSTNLFKFFLHF